MLGCWKCGSVDVWLGGVWWCGVVWSGGQRGGIEDFQHCIVITRGQEERTPITASVVRTYIGLRSFAFDLCCSVSIFGSFINHHDFAVILKSNLGWAIRIDRRAGYRVFNQCLFNQLCV